MSNKNQTAEITVEVTEEEYQADLARGLTGEEVMQPGRHTFRRGAFLARHGLTTEQKTKPTKVHVSIDLDQDLFDFVKERAMAAKDDDASYEDQINAILRAAMEEVKTYSTPLSHQAEELLADTRFIDAVAKQVTQLLVINVIKSS